MNPGWFHGRDSKFFGDKLPRIYVGTEISSRTSRREVAVVGRKKTDQRDTWQATEGMLGITIKGAFTQKSQIQYMLPKKSERSSPSITDEEKEKSRFGLYVFREVLGRGNLKCMNFAVLAADCHGSDLQGQWTTREAPTLPEKRIPSSLCPSPRPQRNNLAWHWTCMLYFEISDFWIRCQYHGLAWYNQYQNSNIRDVKISTGTLQNECGWNKSSNKWYSMSCKPRPYELRDWSY